MYFCDWDGNVSRANLDGSGIEVLATGYPDPNGIALDISGGKLYWTDWANGALYRANLNGTGLETLITGLTAPAGLCMDIEP